METTPNNSKSTIMSENLENLENRIPIEEQGDWSDCEFPYKYFNGKYWVLKDRDPLYGVIQQS